MKLSTYKVILVLVAIIICETCQAVAQAPSLANQAENLSITDKTFLQGKELYEKGQFADALKYFNVVLALDNAHALAREYAQLAQQQLDLLNEPGYKEWRLSFDARQFDKAAATYSRIRSDQARGAAQLAGQIEAQYQKVLSNLVDSWKAACATNDLQRSNLIRNEVANIAPGLSFGRDALGQMQPCSSASSLDSTAANQVIPSKSASPSRAAPANARTPANPRKSATRTPANAPKTPPAQTTSGCIRRDPMDVMKQLKFRFSPQIDPSLQRYVGRGIVVSIEIDDKGNVTVKRVAKANARIADTLKIAVQEWKFDPIVIDNRPTCVDTDLPITLIQPTKTSE